MTSRARAIGAGLREDVVVRIGRRTRSSAFIGWTLVGAIAAGIASTAVAASLGAALSGMPVALAFGLALLHGAAIPLALLKPFAAGAASLVAVTLTAVATAGADPAPWPWAVTTMVTQALVVAIIGVQAKAAVGILSWLLPVGASILVWTVFPRDADASAVNVIVAASVAAGALVAGMVLREWRSIRDQLIRERAVSAEEHQGRVLAEEKTRIARELHDVVAHNLSIITVRASTAAYRHADVPPAVVQEFDEIAAETRGAMEELRSLLSVLRADDADRELAPQPGFADIPELVAGAERSGVAVDFEFDTGARDDAVPDLIGLAAYRIVQEAISNALRHAPGAPLRVACVRGEHAVRLEIVNGSAETVAGAEGSGLGLVGMRERATGVGGTLEAGPSADGGYAVRAVLPLEAAGGAG